jgi:putative transposase
VEYQLIAPKKVVSNAVGVDLGLNSFAVLSDGVVIDNPRYYRKSQDELKEVQSKYSLQKGKATKRKLSALHRKVSNQRKDFLHKESRRMIDTYDLIAHEDLNIKGLAQLSLSKSVHDAGWGMFIAMLTYKAEEAGTHVVAVNPYRTSQTCSNCGAIVKKTLADRQHDCPQCGLSMDRDLNAAHNILKLGTSLAEQTCLYPEATFEDGSSHALRVR